MAVLGGCARPVARAALLAALAVVAGPSAAGVPPAAPARPAAVLPRLPAPLGLSFGMRPNEVALPVVVPPPPLAAMAPLRQTQPPAAALPADPPRHRPGSLPTSLFPSGAASGEPPAAGIAPPPPRPPAVAMPRQPLRDDLDGYLRVCETAFDQVSSLAAGDQEWLAWRAEHLRGGEGSDFFDHLADRAGMAVAPVPAPAAEASAWRSAGLYRFDGADGRRLVCLLFTVDGLAQVFLAGHALDGLRDGVVASLESQRRLEAFALTREARRFSLSLRRPACGLYCRLFGERMLVERRLWLDPRARILVAAKRGLLASGFTGAFAGAGVPGEVFDGLPDSFLASIDLTRRAFVLRQPSPPALTGSAGSTAVFAPAPAGTTRKVLVDSFVP